MRIDEMVIASVDEHIDVGLANRHWIGIDKLRIEVDYPHSDLWPTTPEGLWRSIESVRGGIPDAEIDLISPTRTRCGTTASTGSSGWAGAVTSRARWSRRPTSSACFRDRRAP